MTAADIIPHAVTPKELAKELGVSPRRVQDEVKALGCYCKIGAKVLMFAHHVETYVKEKECRSGSTNAGKSGTTQELSPDGDYEALRARRKKPERKGSRRKSRRNTGDVISMAQPQA